MLGEIFHQFPNFNGCSVEVWEWIRNFIPHFTVHVITNSLHARIEVSKGFPRKAVIVKQYNSWTHFLRRRLQSSQQLYQSTVYKSGKFRSVGAFVTPSVPLVAAVYEHVLHFQWQARYARNWIVDHCIKGTCQNESCHSSFRQFPALLFIWLQAID